MWGGYKALIPTVEDAEKIKGKLYMVKERRGAEEDRGVRDGQLRCATM